MPNDLWSYLDENLQEVRNWPDWKLGEAAQLIRRLENFNDEDADKVEDGMSESMTDPLEELKNLGERMQCSCFDMVPEYGTELKRIVPALEDARKLAVQAEREACAFIVHEYAVAYPEDIFIPPAPGEHAKTVDACSARALRIVLPNVERDVRSRGSSDAFKEMLAEAREEAYKRGYNDRARAERAETHGEDRTVLCRKCGTPVVFLCKNTAEALAEARAELETLKWLAPYLDDPDASEAAHERIAELESDHGKSEG